MKINNVANVDFDDTTIAVTATADVSSQEEILNIFYVQTVDSEYRSDLGCWITVEEGDGEDIDQDDYPDFDFDTIIEAAENFLNQNIEEEETDYDISGQTVYLIHSKNSVKIVTRNSNFINKYTSSYQRQYSDPIAEFDTKEEAIEYLEKLKNE